ncbi:MAG: tRNA pseudouridine(38-40) synthase TruA [Terrimicrobiaceae bacterium]
MRLRLTVAYDGTQFSGWQSQAHGRAVQDALESAFRLLCGERVVVHGAGRTDSGVHAEGQSAHVDVPDDRLPDDAWLPAINAHIPPGVRVMRLKKAAPDFHARFSARGKIYRYSIWNGPVMPPLLINRVWHVPGKLDAGLLRSACEAFTGRHDFAAFCARGSKAPEPTTRTVSAIRLARKGPALAIAFEGEGFLYKMVRMLVASAIRCASGRISHDEIRLRLENAGPRTNHVAPAGGLCLVRVLY